MGKDKKEITSLFMLISAMLTFGTIGIFRRYIPLSSSVIALSRGVIGTLFLILFCIVKKIKVDFSAVKNNLLYLILSGILIGFNWILLFEAYKYTTVAVATLCYYMAPIFIIIASPFLLKEKITLKKALCVIAAFAAMIPVSGVLDSGSFSSHEIKGIIFGLFAAVLYASVVLINKKTPDMEAIDKTVIQLLSASLTLIPYTLFTENISDIHISKFSFIMLMAVGVIHTGIAYALYFGSLKYIKAQAAALLSYIDPVSAIVLSAIFLNEHMTISAAIGAVCVILSAVISELPDKKSSR